MPILARKTLLAASVAAFTAAAAVAPPATAYLNDKSQPSVTASPGARLTFDKPTVKTAAAKPTFAQLSVASTNPTKLASPLRHPVPTSPYGARINPLTGMQENHTGQDYGAACGTEVIAAAAGTVIFSGWHPSGGGNRVEVQHANSLRTTYNHLAASSVQLGQKVRRGQPLAHVGSTGASTGCHLHFEVWVHGAVTEPTSWLH